jgi:hypothetical protein
MTGHEGELRPTAEDVFPVADVTVAGRLGVAAWP